MSSTKQLRNLSDTLILSGILTRADADGGVYPEDADWAGATGEIHIMTDVKVPVGVLTEACTITPPSGDTLARYRYVGDIGVIEQAGNYIYKIHVTFADDTELTWPNDKTTKYQLEMVAALPEVAP